ncbi:hypothetical protein [Parvularcula maris]|uniref:Uncharacterized protein n=1 Tax=Parvularcula maris TaxID=2965077 RepID=A0A9X2L6W3_9PROT|nr:hypothetical protein [Parvularcula maris]MCQ8184249.1 hypothetical protein [Parvularcula maris]
MSRFGRTPKGSRLKTAAAASVLRLSMVPRTMLSAGADRLELLEYAGMSFVVLPNIVCLQP